MLGLSSADAGPLTHSKISSFDRSRVQHFINLHKLPSESLVKETVPSSTVASLLKAHGRESVDIVAIDTEGMDHLVCSQVLKLNPLPEIIHFEYCNSPIQSVLDLMESLNDLGYHFARSGIDITARRSK